MKGYATQRHTVSRHYEQRTADIGKLTRFMAFIIYRYFTTGRNYAQLLLCR